MDDNWGSPHFRKPSCNLIVNLHHVSWYFLILCCELHVFEILCGQRVFGWQGKHPWNFIAYYWIVHFVSLIGVFDSLSPFQDGLTMWKVHILMVAATMKTICLLVQPQFSCFNSSFWGSKWFNTFSERTERIFLMFILNHHFYQKGPSRPDEIWPSPSRRWRW